MITAHFSYLVRKLFLLSFFVFFLFFFLGCEDKHFSPQPGILEIHLKSKTTRFLPPNDSTRHGFRLKISSLSLYRSDGAYLKLFSDVRATERYSTLIDLLDSTSLDSSLIIGQTYTPPGTYNRLDMTISPIAFSFYNGFGNAFIQVADGRTEGNEITRLSQSIQVKEFKKTIITITCDVDSSLVQQPEHFLFRPIIWISSIKYQ